MTILILSQARDAHAKAIQWGLRELGYLPVLWNWADFPRTDGISANISMAPEDEFEIETPSGLLSGPFDIIWNRRAYKPSPSECSSKLDHQIIKNESWAFLNGCIEMAGDSGTFWANDWHAARRANHKIYQLQLAKQAGFSIPDTLFSNHPQQVREFFARNQGKIVYKAFKPGGWYQESGASAVLRTALLKSEHLADDNAIKACPGIYQKLLEKHHEIRITVMGQHLLAATITGPAFSQTTDWRYDADPATLTVTPATIDPAIAAKCMKLCNLLGLVFGCIDLIVDVTGNVYFLEINESGQFLWKEDACPDLPMLSAFCSFLLSKGKSISLPQTCGLKLADFDSSIAGQEYIAMMQIPAESANPMLTLEPARQC